MGRKDNIFRIYASIFRPMRRIVPVILAFLFLFGCHTGTGKEPFDRHAELVFTKHARCRMDCRHITSKEIQEVLENGEINYNKSEPNSHPDSKYAIEGYTEEQQHLRIIVAPDNTKLIIITCIELGVEWSCHCD